MPATAAQPSTAKTTTLPLAVGRQPKTLAWDTFRQRFLFREDGYKYEWVSGTVVKTKRSMDKSQLYILLNLQIFFRQLQQSGKAEGELISEPDLFFLANHRRPDIAWLTTKQIYALADPKAYEVPAFLIEVISSSDQINAMKLKMINYRDAGVQVVWQIFPEHQQVDVYAGPNLRQMTVCTGDDLCAAAPALPNFALPVKAIFYKPKK